VGMIPYLGIFFMEVNRMPDIFVVFEDEEDREIFTLRVDRDRLMHDPLQRVYFSNRLAHLGKRVIDKLKQEKKQLKKKGK